MNQEDVLRQIEGLAALDQGARNLADQIVVLMFDTVSNRVAEPSVGNYASFMLSYVKKQPELVPLLTAGIVFSAAPSKLRNQILAGLCQVLKQ